MVYKVRRRADHVSIRNVSDMNILFYDHETIYVTTKNYTYLFHRWLEKERNYKDSFSPFRRFLAENKTLDIYDICRRANRYGIIIQTTRTIPDISNRQIKILKGKQ